ncbi:unnamed protein product [Paramecium primaurelia]|uniref:Transmembrane protein n=1 Tax=Paramecium primaurelia TaxID=5886 RepID=A0A8S1PTK0_PARPR|nr:unnamed protein product [Paramecium primaurelia]
MKLFLLLVLILLVSQGRKIIKKHVKSERYSRQSEFDSNQQNNDDFIDKFSESEIQISEHLSIGEDIINIINQQSIEYENQVQNPNTDQQQQQEQQQQQQQEDITQSQEIIYEQSDQLDLESVEFDQLLQSLANDGHDFDIEIPIIKKDVIQNNINEELIETKLEDLIQDQQNDQQNSDQIEQTNYENDQNTIHSIDIEEPNQQQDELKQSEQIETFNKNNKNNKNNSNNNNNKNNNIEIPIQIDQINLNDQSQSIDINNQDDSVLNEQDQQNQIQENEVLIIQQTEPVLDNQIDDISIIQQNENYLEQQKIEDLEQVVNQSQDIDQDQSNNDQIINHQDAEQEIEQIYIENTQENSQQTDQSTILTNEQIQDNNPENLEQILNQDHEDNLQQQNEILEDNIYNTETIQENNVQQLENQESDPIIENNDNIQNQDNNQQLQQEQIQINEEIITSLDDQQIQQQEQILNQNQDQEINENVQQTTEQILRDENQDQIPEIQVQDQLNENQINNNVQNEDQIQTEQIQDQENILIDPHAKEYDIHNGHLNHDHNHDHDNNHENDHYNHNHYNHNHNEHIHDETFNNQNDNQPNDPNSSISQQPSCSFDDKLSCSGNSNTQFSTGIETESYPQNQEQLLQYLLTHSYLQYYTNYPLYFFGILANVFLFSLVILKNVLTKTQTPYSTQISDEQYNEVNVDNSQIQFQINQLDNTLSDINTKLDTLSKSYLKMQKDHQLINQIINDLQTKVLANLEKRKLKESCKSLNESNEDDAGVRQKRTQTQVKPRQRPTTPIQRQY